MKTRFTTPILACLVALFCIPFAGWSNQPDFNDSIPLPVRAALNQALLPMALNPDMTAAQLTPNSALHEFIPDVDSGDYQVAVHARNNRDYRALYIISQFWKNNAWVDSIRTEYEYEEDTFIIQYIVVKLLKNGVWVNLACTHLTFNEDGQETETRIQFWQDEMWVNSFRIVTEYTDGLMTTRISQNWVDGAWANLTRNFFSYTNGLVTENLSQGWLLGDWLNLARTTYTYNEDDLPDETVTAQWTGLDWQDSNKRIYSFNAANDMTEVLIQTWLPTTTWQNANRTLYTYTDGLLTNEHSQSWQAGNWTSLNDNTYDYDDMERLIEEIYRVFTGDHVWLNIWRETTTYEANRRTMFLEENWVDGAWENDERDLYFYEDDNYVNSEQITQYWDGEWINEERLLFNYEDIPNGGEVTIAEVVGYILDFVEFTPVQVDLADRNDDGSVNIVDVVIMTQE